MSPLLPRAVTLLSFGLWQHPLTLAAVLAPDVSGAREAQKKQTKKAPLQSSARFFTFSFFSSKLKQAHRKVAAI